MHQGLGGNHSQKENLSCWTESSSHHQIGSTLLLIITLRKKHQSQGSEQLQNSWGHLKKREYLFPRLQHTPAAFPSPKNHTTSPHPSPQNAKHSLPSPRSDNTQCSLPGLFWAQHHTAFATKYPTSYHPLPWSPITVTQASPPDLPTLSPPLNYASVSCLSSTCHAWEPQPFHTYNQQACKTILFLK